MSIRIRVFGSMSLVTLLALGSDPFIDTAQAAGSNVNVVNVPTVTVGNTELQPIPVKEPLKEPVNLDFQLQITQARGISDAKAFDIPAGRRLTIEHMSFLCTSDTTQKIVVLQLVGNGNLLSALPGMTFPNDGSSGVFSVTVGAGPVSAHLDEEAIGVFARRFGSAPFNGTTNCTVTVLGYLTLLP